MFNQINTFSHPPLVLFGHPSIVPSTREEFYLFCLANPEMRIERTAEGDLNILPPTGGETGRRNGEVLFQLGTWSKQNSTDVAFDSSTGLWLPNGAMRSPDASWVKRERWDALSQQEREKFPPLALTLSSNCAPQASDSNIFRRRCKNMPSTACVWDGSSTLRRGARKFIAPAKRQPFWTVPPRSAPIRSCPDSSSTWRPPGNHIAG